MKKLLFLRSLKASVIVICGMSISLYIEGIIGDLLDNKPLNLSITDIGDILFFIYFIGIVFLIPYLLVSYISFSFLHKINSKIIKYEILPFCLSFSLISFLFWKRGLNENNIYYFLLAGMIIGFSLKFMIFNKIRSSEA